MNATTGRAEDLSEVSSGHAHERYLQVRATTQGLAEPLSAEDCQAQSMPDASPVKWHLAHSTWFFETFMLERFEPEFTPFDASFRMLFNSYYNSVGEKHPRPHRGLLTRPSLDRVLAYRAHVDERMRAVIDRHAGRDAAFDALLALGLNHEQQHQELILMDVKHLLWCNPLRPAYRRAAVTSVTPTLPTAWVHLEGGVVDIGHAGEAFGFDNETPRHKVLLRPFELANRPVTQGEYLAFIEDGGYERPEFWLSLGWEAVCDGGWRAPLYWERLDDEWHVFTLAGRMPLSRDLPVCHLSYFEADAFARWSGARLPTEAEWEYAAQCAEPTQAGANTLDAGTLMPQPARAPHAGCAFSQLLGDVWEWTSSSYAPYPGFAPPPGAVGEYNGKFMCNQYVLRGGSFATPASHLRPTYRNFFPPGTQWQFAGVRLARDIAG